MSVKRLYSCDLCGVGGKNLVGILWSGDHARDWNLAGEDPVRRDVIHQAGWANVEHHLCKNCIKDIERLAGEIKS